MSENKSGVSIKVLNQFGDPETALNKERHELLHTIKQGDNGDYYIPAIPMSGYAKLLRVNPHHGSLPSYKARLMAKYLVPNDIISRKTLIQCVTDGESSGNGYFIKRKIRAGQIHRLDYLPMINTRRMIESDRYCTLLNTQHDREFIPFEKGEVIHIMQHDPYQQIYGTPYWFGAFQSILLGEDVRIFPRLFFKNGGSTGDILATAGLSTKEQDIVDEIIGRVKGGGRFNRVLLQFPRGEIDKIIKTIPYSTGSDKIDFSKLAGLSKTDVLEAWRMPPELAGMMPEGPGASRDLEKIREMYHEDEIVPLQQQYADAINEHLPRKKWIKFEPYKKPED